MKYIFRHKIIAGLLTALIYCVVILPINESVWFAPNLTNHIAILYQQLLKAMFFVFFFCLSWVVIHIAEKLFRKDAFYLSWLKYASAYGLVLLVVFLLIYPGWWQWDEFHMLNNTEFYIVQSWQHIFTQFWYVLSLYLIPSAIGIVILEAVGIALTVGYLLARTKQVLGAGRAFYLLALPFLTLPVLASNFMPLRATPYAYILTVVLFEFVLLAGRIRQSRNVYAEFMAIGAGVAILATWRTEGVAYLLLLPVLAYRLGLIRELRLPGRHKAVVALAAAVLFCAGALLMTRATTDPKYQITATINPLSMMLHDKLRGDTARDWRRIDAAVNLDVLRGLPDYTDVPSFWAPGGVRPDAAANLSDYQAGAKDIILHNPELFLKYRLKTFAATNDLQEKWTGAWPGWLAYYQTSSGEQRYLPARFLEQNPAATPLNPELRRKTLRFMLQENHYPVMRYSRAVLWTVIPAIAAMTGIFVLSIVRKQWHWTLTAALLLLHSSIVFLTAPASYFMYYFPVFVAGGFLAIFYVVSAYGRTDRKPGLKHIKRAGYRRFAATK